jgi:SRSO17 transposase
VAKRYLHGLAQAETATFAAMAAVVEDGCEQQFQHFISNAPWRHEPVIDQIGRDADRLLGGKPDSALIIDESSFVKQGGRSVGVARQWCGRLGGGSQGSVHASERKAAGGKVDNCQVAVFAVLTDGARHTPVDLRLYLPQRWIDDPARCDRAEIPTEARQMRAKTALALEMVRAARARGMRFDWVGVDGGYGKEPAFLRALDDMGETFVADVHSDQRV